MHGSGDQCLLQFAQSLFGAEQRVIGGAQIAQSDRIAGAFEVRAHRGDQIHRNLGIGEKADRSPRLKQALRKRQQPFVQRLAFPLGNLPRALQKIGIAQFQARLDLRAFDPVVPGDDQRGIDVGLIQFAPGVFERLSIIAREVSL